MKDSPHSFRQVTIKKAFEISSNVGIAKKISECYKGEEGRFIDRISKMGLSTPLDIELLYPSYLRMPDANSFKTSKTSLPWMSIGYEMALTPLHVLTFYNAVANNGIMMKPIFTTSILSEGLEIVR